MADDTQIADWIDVTAYYKEVEGLRAENAKLKSALELAHGALLHVAESDSQWRGYARDIAGRIGVNLALKTLDDGIKRFEAENAKLQAVLRDILALLSDGPGGPRRITAMKVAREALEEGPPMSEHKDHSEAKLRALAKAILECEPDDMAADGVTCLMVWRKEAREALEETQPFCACCRRYGHTKFECPFGGPDAEKNSAAAY
jgi:hypothetical protein